MRNHVKVKSNNNNKAVKCFENFTHNCRHLRDNKKRRRKNNTTTHNTMTLRNRKTKETILGEQKILKTITATLTATPTHQHKNIM